MRLMPVLRISADQSIHSQNGDLRCVCSLFLGLVCLCLFPTLNVHVLDCKASTFCDIVLQGIYFDLRFVLFMLCLLFLFSFTWYACYEQVQCGCGCLETCSKPSLLQYIVCLLFHTPFIAYEWGNFIAQTPYLHRQNFPAIILLKFRHKDRTAVMRAILQHMFDKVCASCDSVSHSYKQIMMKDRHAKSVVAFILFWMCLYLGGTLYDNGPSTKPNTLYEMVFCILYYGGFLTVIIATEIFGVSFLMYFDYHNIRYKCNCLEIQPTPWLPRCVFCLLFHTLGLYCRHRDRNILPVHLDQRDILPRRFTQITRKHRRS